MSRASAPRMICGFCLLVMFSFRAAPLASAYKLTFYYDPDTGNVSLDTAETRTGEVISFGLRIYDSSIKYKPENRIALTPSPLSFTDFSIVQEATFSNPMIGLLTVGNVLPRGLSEDLWTSLYYHPSGAAFYSPGLGLPSNENIEFAYGRPNREFDNRWDLVDPDTLEWATAASLIYQQGSGEVLLDTRGNDGGHISGFVLRSDGSFAFENFTPPWNSPFQENDANRIDLLGDAIEPRVYSLGNILDEGLTEGEYESLFTSAKFLGRVGFGGDLDLETEGQAFSMVFVAVPEPTSGLLMVLAGLVLLTCRQKPMLRYSHNSRASNIPL